MHEEIYTLTLLLQSEDLFDKVEYLHYKIFSNHHYSKELRHKSAIEIFTCGGGFY